LYFSHRAENIIEFSLNPPVIYVYSSGMGRCQYLRAHALPRKRSREKGRGGRQLWANDSIHNSPMLEPGRKRHPLSIIVVCKYESNHVPRDLLRMVLMVFIVLANPNSDGQPEPLSRF
jgi:hypothetical protein